MNPSDSVFNEITLHDQLVLIVYVCLCVSEERPSDSKLVTSVVGDVRKLADILAVMPGCTTVIHCAAVVDFRLFPDTASMYDVNVKGYVITTPLL